MRLDYSGGVLFGGIFGSPWLIKFVLNLWTIVADLDFNDANQLFNDANQLFKLIKLLTKHSAGGNRAAPGGQCCHPSSADGKRPNHNQVGCCWAASSAARGCRTGQPQEDQRAGP